MTSAGLYSNYTSEGLIGTMCKTYYRDIFIEDSLAYSTVLQGILLAESG